MPSSGMVGALGIHATAPGARTAEHAHPDTGRRPSPAAARRALFM